MSPVDNVRIGWVGFGLGVCFVVAALSQAEAQLWGAKATIAKAREAGLYEASREDPARRGFISSADGQLLATNDDRYELVLDPSRTPVSPAFLIELAAASGLPYAELAAAARTARRLTAWERALHPSQAEAVNRIKKRWRADGLGVKLGQMRAYPLGDAASGIVGRLVDGKPVAGLELSANKLLAGTDGYRRGMTDRTGAFLPMRMSDDSRARVDGQSLRLTIDSRLQLTAAAAVRRAVETHRASSGVAIVLDPGTGDLLAMANWPSADPERPRATTGISPDFNPNVMGAYEPGSTFKVLTLAKALDLGVVSRGSTLNCTGELRYNRHWRVRCSVHQGKRAHGQVDLERAIAKSCNVAAATWALRIGYERMTEFLEKDRIIARTQLGLPLERAGLFDRGEYAKPLQLMNLGFGQALTATPVALAGAFSILANEGRYVTPRIIASVDGRPIPSRAPERVIGPEAAGEVLRLMEAVIQSDAGTGRSLRLPGYRLAGKTGTAQKVDRATGKMGGGYVSSFVGFVPAERPRAVVLVMIDEPKAGGFYGSEVAGPVFLEIARDIVARLGIPPSDQRGETG
jgi:cell division protein FtsI/penicillin-binding protein 2